MAITIMPVVRREVEEFVQYWNTHHIRPSFGAAGPSGRPDDLYDMPQLYGKYLFRVEPTEKQAPISHMQAKSNVAWVNLVHTNDKFNVHELI